MSTKDLTPAELEAVAKLLEAARRGWMNEALMLAREPAVHSALAKMREMKGDLQ